MKTELRKPRFNHVAMSVSSDLLADEGRAELCRFYGDVFGWNELPTETVDRKKLVFGVHEIEQFVFLIADDSPMVCPRLDHYGLSVATMEELDAVFGRGDGIPGARRPRRHRRQGDDRPRDAEDHQHLHRVPAADDGRDPTLGVHVTLRYGAFAPQGWKLEYTGWGAADAWARTQEIALLAERVGYDHLWVYDHVETVPRREPTHVFEAFTTLAALAPITSTIRLGQLVTCSSYRNAGLLAKETACIDVFSGGRLILGLGAGWYEREYQAYDYPFLAPRERLRVLDETLTVVKRLWTEETVTFEGEHLRFDGAYCDPKPLQSLPPIWVGGGGEQVTLAIAARQADATNWQVGLDQFVHKSAVLREHCERIGRDPESIVRTHGPDCRLFDSDRELQAWLDSPGGGQLWGRGDPDEYVRDNLVGTPEQVAEKVQGFVDAGCAEFVLWFRDFPATESLERFMAEVVPAIAAP